MLWIGILILAVAIAGIRSRLSQATALATIAGSALVYWGMFGYQASTLVSADNFVGRLYLIPFSVILFLLFRDGDNRVLLVFAFSSLLASTMTFRDHIRFQNVYAEIYRTAASLDETLVVHYPLRELDDPIRDILVGNYPDADYAIAVEQAKLVSRN